MTTRALWPLLVVVGLFCLAGTASAQDPASQPWLHVQISGDGDGDDHHDGDDGHGDSEGRHDGDDGHGDSGGRHDGDDGHGDSPHDDEDDGRGDGDSRRDDGDEEHGDDGGHQGADFDVNINVPLSAVEPLLSLVPHRIVSDGRLTVADHDMPIDIGSMRALWRALADVGDTEFLTVDSDNETVRISRTGDQFLVQMEECGEDGGETVDIRFPVVVLDALLSGDGETLNVGAAVERLAGLRGDIVRVRADDYQVRVWIDEVAHPSE